MRFLLLLAFAACSTSSGSSSPTIRASAYDQSCTQSTDCVTVSEGEVCGCGGCPNAVINRADEQRYSNDYAQLHQECTAPPAPCPGYQCANPQVACAAGTCVLCSQIGGCADAGADASDAARD